MNNDNMKIDERLLILADDLTGALDSGAQFAKKGISVEVFTSVEAADSFSKTDDESSDDSAASSVVRVINTNSRHLDAEQARAAINAALNSSSSYSFFYKKTDSCLRGNIGAELEAFINTLNITCLPFVPAYPDLKRITCGGTQFLEGKPIHESSMAKDPFNPITESFIPAIISRQSSVSVQLVSDKDDDTDESRGILVFDGETNDDLRRTADSLTEKNMLRASAGCAGFAGALMEVLPLCKNTDAFFSAHIEKLPLLIVSGSLHSVSINQVKTALNANVSGFALKAEEMLHYDRLTSPDGGAFVSSCADTLKGEGIAILGTEASFGGNSASLGNNSSVNGEMAAEALGKAVKHITEKVGALHLVVFGGDTLVSIMHNLCYTRLEPLAEIRPGIVLVKASGQGNESFIVTKAGAFGSEDLISVLKDYFDGTVFD